MAQKTKVGLGTWLNTGLKRTSLFHFLLVVGYSLQIIIYDASKVITPEVVLHRWLAAGALLAVTAVVWYLAHNQNNDIATYKRLTFLLITADIAFASFNVYTQRGMASRAVLLYTIPVVLSAILLSRAALFATAVLASAAYIVTAVTYFTVYFNEGFKAELYSEVLFYSFSLFVLAGLLSALIRFGGNTNSS